MRERWAVRECPCNHGPTWKWWGQNLSSVSGDGEVGLNLTEKEIIVASRLWASPMCFPHGSDIAILEATRLLTIRATPFILKSINSVLIPPPHPTAFFLQPPVSSPSWALHHYGLFLAWAHTSRWLIRCFMALRHLKLIMCKTDLHFSFTNLQLLHFFLFSELAPASSRGVVLDTSVFYTVHIYRIAQFYWVHTSNITPSTFILHIARGILLKQEFDIYHSKSLWTTSHFSRDNDLSP